MTNKQDYAPIPVSEAKRLAESFGKSMVVVLAYDPAYQLTHTTTYGIGPQEKEIAADTGERCAKLICGEAGFQLRKSYEDYRTIPAAERAAEIDKLRDAIRKHRDQLGDDCWRDKELYRVLPEGDARQTGSE